MIHHSVNKAQTRRLRKELLTQSAWEELVRRKGEDPITIETAYDLIWEQYNLGGIDRSKLESPSGMMSKWDWRMPD